MVDRNRQNKKVMVASIDVNCVSLKNLHDDVVRLMAQWGPDALVEEVEGYYNSRSTEVFAFVPETDEQMAARISKEERRQQEQTQREMQEFARLKAKFVKLGG
jgi:hypothetical protein